MTCDTRASLDGAKSEGERASVSLQCKVSNRNKFKKLLRRFLYEFNFRWKDFYQKEFRLLRVIIFPC